MSHADVSALRTSASALSQLGKSLSTHESAIPKSLPSEAWSGDGAAAIAQKLELLRTSVDTASTALTSSASVLSTLADNMEPIAAEADSISAQPMSQQLTTGGLPRLQVLQDEIARLRLNARSSLDKYSGQAASVGKSLGTPSAAGQSPNALVRASNLLVRYGQDVANGIAIVDGAILIGGAIFAAIGSDGILTPLAVGAIALENEIIDEDGTVIGTDLAASRGTQVINEEAGKPGAWNPALNNPAPNTTYLVDDRYSFSTNEYGETSDVSVKLTPNVEAGARNTYRQLNAGGADRLDSDQGGHLIASRFGGPGESINLTAMAKSLNASGGDYYNMENTWGQALNEGKTVDVQIRQVFDAATQRPSIFMVTYQIEGSQPVFRIFDNATE